MKSGCASNKVKYASDSTSTVALADCVDGARIIRVEGMASITICSESLQHLVTTAFERFAKLLASNMSLRYTEVANS